ncbi:MAG TPA: response regulator transcription factor [Blastocatellia bacterium]|nr:response regulator transcription factor [Blastocatellia bacterium]
MQNISGKRILIVDDNKSIRKMVADYLISRGYEVEEAIDGIQGLDRGLSSSPDVIILDVVMPGIDGFKLCQLLREKGVKTLILMLTERATLEDKVTGFSYGADDYLAKPFSPLELELRIQALLRRATAEPRQPGQRSIKHGDLEIDLDRHTVTIGGREVSLTPIEFDILKLLASSPGYVYSRQDLLSVIWDTAYEGYKRNIDPHVNRLRTKIEENPKKPKYVLTVWGVGYKFNDALAE